MARKIRNFKNGKIYHVTIRRIGDGLLFKSIHDYYRGIFSIYEFNNSKPVTIRERRKERARFKEKIRGLASVDSTEARPLILLEDDKRDKLVEVLGFCFMPNHIHLLLRQIQDNGISKFMQKFGGGYARYFKDKYSPKKRMGHIFQDRFVAKLIDTEEYAQIVFVYVHTNPLSLIEPKWKELGVKNPRKAIKFLENYKWSSYQDYLDKPNFVSVTKREHFLKIMNGVEGCQKAVNRWVQDKKDLQKMLKKLFSSQSVVINPKKTDPRGLFNKQTSGVCH